MLLQFNIPTKLWHEKFLKNYKVKERKKILFVKYGHQIQKAKQLTAL